MDENSDYTPVTPENFSRRYWLKRTLQDFARRNGIDASGGKNELSGRIEHYLKTGQTAPRESQKNIKSQFDWNHAPLHRDTTITDNYRNTRQVRNFFIGELGPEFSFNIAFLEWLKNNAGRTLGDAVLQWLLIREEVASGKAKSEPSPQFEYNRYVRAYFADNPGGTLKEAIHCWRYKKSVSGKPVYERADLGRSADNLTGRG